jgi:hypothetical protein
VGGGGKGECGGVGVCLREGEAGGGDGGHRTGRELAGGEGRESQLAWWAAAPPGEVPCKNQL